MPFARCCCLLALAALLGACHGHAAPASGATAPRVHGHNDYLQARPLHDALRLGLHSVEADVFLEDGELRVGHERWQLRAGRTLASMYLDPLAAHAAAHGGAILADGSPFVLLVDIKSDADAVLTALDRELTPHHSLLTRFTDARCEPGAITVLLSGARPRDALARRAERWCALDGRPADLDQTPPPSRTLMPWISAPWSSVSDWNGADDPLPDECARVRALAAKAHAQGRELRFWAAPDRPEAWRLLAELGVDRIGTDRPKAAMAWWHAR